MPGFRGPGGWLESVLHLVEGAIGLGLVSGAAVASALGNFFLGGVLAVLAVGVILRFKRGRLRKP